MQLENIENLPTMALFSIQCNASLTFCITIFDDIYLSVTATSSLIGTAC